MRKGGGGILLLLHFYLVSHLQCETIASCAPSFVYLKVKITKLINSLRAATAKRGMFA